MAENAHTAALPVALIGCGVIGQTHADAILHEGRLRISALIDPDTAAAEALAETIHTRTGTAPAVFASLAGMSVAGISPYLVAIATPSGLHVEQATAALELGAHVIIEKPLDVDLSRARTLAAAAERAASRGQVCSVVSQHRFDPASGDVHAAIARGDLGSITSAVATVPWWRSQEYYDSGTWRGTWALDGGGALMNQGVHTLDLLLWFLGKPESITARYARLAHSIEVEDTVVATIAFARGELAVLHATTAAYPGLQVRLQVHGTSGSAVIEADELRYLHLGDLADPEAEWDGGDQSARLASSVEIPEGIAPFTFGHLRQYRDVLDAIETGRDPLLTVSDALVTLATVRAIYLAASLGESIELDAVLAGEYDGHDLKIPNAHSLV